LARANTEGGTVMPSALAVLILIAISNLVERFAGHLEHLEDEIYSHRNHDLRWRQRKSVLKPEADIGNAGGYVGFERGP